MASTEFNGSYPQADQNRYCEGDVSDEVRQMFELVNHLVLSGPLCLCGIFANVVNIRLYATQGLEKTITIGFFALAWSDLLTLVFLEMYCVALNPLAESTEILRLSSYLVSGWPHICFYGISCTIVVYITAERCLCIAMPLHVRQIITPNRTRLVITFIYISILAALLPEYITLYLGWTFDRETNKTSFSLIGRANRASVQGMADMFFAVLWLVLFFTAALLTITLIRLLRKSSAWRRTAMSKRQQSETIATRDKSSMVMVVTVSTILISCSVLQSCLLLVGFLIPDFRRGGQFSNLFISAWSVAHTFEAINASANIIVYYKLNPSYRQRFRETFTLLCHRRQSKCC